jgi:microcystin degradation protein MlrC
MRVGVLVLRHESNTFLPTPTDLGLFEVLVGDRVRERWSGTHNEMGGFLAGIEAAGEEPVPVFSAVAVPGGTIPAETFGELVRRLLDEVAARGPFDVLLAAAHGAAVSEHSEHHRDADGHWLGRLRRALTPGTPLVVVVDAHANVSAAMLDACDALIAYRTNPHLDPHDRGLEAARLALQMARGEIRPVQAGAFPPLAIDILLQETAARPSSTIVELVDAVRARPGILSASMALGFPYADVPEMGTSFVVVSDGDEGLARSCADELATELLARRETFVPSFISPTDAIEQAVRSPGPVCLLDMGDNVGGGSAGDGTVLAHLIARRGGPAAFVSLYDPDAARVARELGVGGRATFTVGGKTDGLHGPPLTVDATVRALHDGPFEEPDVRHGGNPRFDMGPTAIVETDAGLTLQLTSLRVPPFSLRQLTSCGLEPRRFGIIVAKGVHAPVPAYAPVCPTVIRVNTPGSTSADMTSFTYRHRRVPLFPLEPLPD